MDIRSFVSGTQGYGTLTTEQTLGDATTCSSLVVLQASPLACPLKTAGGVLQRIAEINLQSERCVMSKIFRDHPSKIVVDFDIATIESVGDFFREHRNRKQYRVAPALHLSCHGAATYLALEDGKGSLQCLTLEILERWLHNTAVKFVFVAACYSRTIGGYFARAGVDHVICADGDEVDMQSGFVLEFSKVLYKRLLSGDTVAEAFDAAQLHTTAIGAFDGQDLCLIGRQTDHNVPIFCEGSPTSPRSLQKPSISQLCDQPPSSQTVIANPPLFNRYSSALHIPSTAQRQGSTFLRHLPAAIRYNCSSFDTPIPKLVSPVRNISPKPTRPEPVLRNTDQDGDSDRTQRAVNKPSLHTQASIESLRLRHSPPHPPMYYVRCDDDKFQIIRALSMAQIVWITGQEPKCGKSTVVQASLSYLQYRLGPNNLEEIFWISQEDGTRGLRDFTNLLEAIKNAPVKRFLIAIEAKNLPETTCLQLVSFLKDLVRKNPFVKILVIHQEKDTSRLQVGKYCCNERSVTVGVLNLESTVKLFATCCPHVGNGVVPDIVGAESLWEVLAPLNAVKLRRHFPRERATAATFALRDPVSVQNEEFTGRIRSLLKLMGGVIPLEVMMRAKHMTSDEYRLLICLGRYFELDNSKYQSYNELVKLQIYIAQALVTSIRKKLYSEAATLQLKYSCVAMVKDETRCLRDMHEELTEINRKMAKERRNEKMDNYANLFKKQNEVWKRLQDEIDSIVKFSSPFKKNDPEVIDICCLRQDIIERLLKHVQDGFVDVSSESFVSGNDDNVGCKFVELLKAVIDDLWVLSLPSRQNGEADDQRPILSTIDEDGEKSDTSSPHDDSDANEIDRKPQALDGAQKPTEPGDESIERHFEEERSETQKQSSNMNRQPSSKTVTTVASTMSGTTFATDTAESASEMISPIPCTSFSSRSNSSGSTLPHRSAVRSFSDLSIDISMRMIQSNSFHQLTPTTPERGIEGQNSMDSNCSVPWWRPKRQNDWDDTRAKSCTVRAAEKRSKKNVSKRKNRQYVATSAISQKHDKRQSMCQQPRKDLRWGTSASSAAKDKSLPVVVRYSPPPQPTEICERAMPQELIQISDSKRECSEPLEQG